MKINLLCKRYYTSKDLIQDRFGRLYHLPVQLAHLGAEIEVTAIDYRHSNAMRRDMEGVSFRTLPATPSRLPGLLFKMHRYIQDDRPNLIIASGDSHIGYLGLQFARRIGVPFVFDVYDYYPTFVSNRIPGLKLLFHQAVVGADLVLCASRPLVEFISPLNNAALLIENGVDRKVFAPKNSLASRVMLGLEEKIPIVGYFGSIFEEKGPLLIDACHILIESFPNLKLLIAGPIKNVVLDQPWIIYFGVLPQETIPQLIAACDVVVVPLANHPQNDLSGSCKIAEYLSCQKPVVATDIAGHREIFRSAPESLCKPDARDMAEAILCQLNHPRVAPFPGSMGWESIGQTLFDALARLIPEHARSSVMHQREPQPL